MAAFKFWAHPMQWGTTFTVFSLEISCTLAEMESISGYHLASTIATWFYSLLPAFEVRLFTCGRTGLDLRCGHCWTLGLGPRFPQAEPGHSFRQFKIEIENSDWIFWEWFHDISGSGFTWWRLEMRSHALPPHYSFPWLLLGTKPGNYRWMSQWSCVDLRVGEWSWGFSLWP